ncbi:MAG: threonine synthase [Desulfitobacteriaceae bacterium]
MADVELYCTRCGSNPTEGSIFDGCSICKKEGVVANYTTKIEIDLAAPHVLRQEEQPGIWKYRRLFPVRPDTTPVSLEEGNTPLLHLQRLGDQMGLSQLYVKDESRNPTWSHKDRLCSVGVTKAKELGARVITVSSTGNHGASTAAYAARAGIPCVAFTTTSVPETMKILMQSYGALLVTTPTPRDRWTLMERCVKDLGWYPMSGYVFPPLGSNPYAIDGYKSIAAEVFEQLGRVPDKVLVPTAYGDALLGIWKGFVDLQQIFKFKKLPQMIAVEPFGALARTLESGSPLPIEVPGGPSVAFSVATTRGTYQGLKVLQESQGYGCEVKDEKTMAMQRRLASEEGLFAEPSSAMAVAGVQELVAQGKLDSDDTIVVLLTSTGLKDPAAAAEHLPKTPLVQPRMEDLRHVLKKAYDFELGG